MGVYTDLLNNAIAWDVGGDDSFSHGIDRVITMQVERLRNIHGDLDYSSAYSEKNEVQYYQYVGGEPAGNYTLTFSLNPSGNISFTTSNIAVEAPLFIIESAINVAASGVVPGWSNGDITVNGCPVIGGCQIYLVYSGNSVKNTNHITVQVNDDYITGTGHFEKVTVTNGQTNRTTMFVLYLLGLINTLPPQGTIDNLSITYSRNNPIMPNHQTLQALAKQASIEDKCDKLYVELMKAFKLTKLL